MARGSIRDSQRQKLYDAEAAVFDRDKAPEYATVVECQEYANYVTASDTWKALGVKTCKPIEITDGRGRRRAAADAFGDEIKLPKWTRSKWQILHELAHIAEAYRADMEYDEDGGPIGWPGHVDGKTGRVVIERSTAPHGTGYAGVYLHLVKEHFGPQSHDVLARAFREGRVKVEPVTVNATPEKHTPVTDGATACLTCGMVLSTVLRPHKFCSDACRYKHHSLKRGERTAPSREKTCEVCGTAFVARRSDAKTCSQRCRQRLHRQKA